MLQNIYSTLEHWWTCCKSLTMQKLPLLYAGCKRQAFREGSCILFCALQTAFGEHLFISHLVKCFFSASFGCFLNETFLLLLFTLSLLKQQQKKMHLDISELSEHLVVRQNWNLKFAPCLKKETAGWNCFKSSPGTNQLPKLPWRGLCHCHTLQSPASDWFLTL